MVFDVPSTSWVAYVTSTIISEDSANPCLFQQCASDVNDLAYVTGAYVSRWQRPESKGAFTRRNKLRQLVERNLLRNKLTSIC